jgi:heme/copper-type cytochrome/quinol oxidase subunit 2
MDMRTDAYNVIFDHITANDVTLQETDLKLYDISNYIVLPLYAVVKLYFMSTDVIHSFGEHICMIVGCDVVD